MILAFPYIYFSLDAGFRSIDVHTLTEASQSLGAGWRTTLGRVIIPNIRVAALAGAFLTLAIVMGEFTIASLAAFHTFPTYIQYINESQAYPAAAVDAHELRDHVGGHALAAPHRTAGRPQNRARGTGEVARMAYLELQGLYRAFGPVVALQGIDLALEQGEFVSLLGPSGCGKTTALRLVAGFDRADAGRIVVDGRDLTRVPPNKRDMGMVFQAYSLFPNMTAAQNVEYGLRIRGKSKSDRRARAQELLELVGLGHAGKRYAHQLSGGMQQRVALARALAIEPRVLLLDEPLSALDAKVRVQLREEIRRIQLELGITTHLRDPRPGGGARDLRSRRCPARRPDRPGWDAGRDVRRPGDAVRRRVHRDDESTGLDGRGRRRRGLRGPAAPRGRSARAYRTASACSCSSVPRP